MLNEMTVLPGHVSRLKVGLLLSREAGAGRVWRSSWTPPSPSALIAHLKLTPLGWSWLASSLSRPVNRKNRIWKSELIILSSEQRKFGCKISFKNLRYGEVCNYYLENRLRECWENDSNHYFDYEMVYVLWKFELLYWIQMIYLEPSSVKYMGRCLV